MSSTDRFSPVLGAGRGTGAEAAPGAPAPSDSPPDASPPPEIWEVKLYSESRDTWEVAALCATREDAVALAKMFRDNEEGDDVMVKQAGFYTPAAYVTGADGSMTPEDWEWANQSIQWARANPTAFS